MNASIDIDIGGTFTDCFVTYGEQTAWCKTRTTAYDLAVGMNDAIAEAAERLDMDVDRLLGEVDIIRYSTTLAMNKLIEHKGPKLGLLMTEGFEDTTLIGRASQWADGIPIKYQRNIARIERPEPLIPKQLIVGVRERVDSTGTIVRPLDENHLREKVQYLVDAGVRGFVVSLLWSFLNPAHEQRVKAIIEEEYHSAYLGAMPVFVASDVAPRIYEYPRTMMAILNAYLHQGMYEELSGIGDELRDRGYHRPMMMIHNTGGMASVLRTSAVSTYNGGPVAGLMGSAHLGKLYGKGNIFASDMGGTSFDIGMVAEGSPRFYQFMPIIDRWMVDATVVDTLSVGAGGGSIARVNTLIANRVEVGPESAGSMPGPVAYNQGGTEPTVTDADVVLGYINPDFFHGGQIRLDADRAARAIRRKIAEPLGVSVEEAALMIRRIVDANMGQAIRRETVLKGFDPRDFVLFAFGGAGPTHCCGYARFAEMRRIVVFPFSATFCAFGSSTMAVVHMYERSHHLHVLHPATQEYLTDYESFNRSVEALRDQARRDFLGEGYAAEDVEFTLELDMKFGGQLNVKRVTSPVLRLESEEDVVKLREAFEREYSAAYSALGLNAEAGIEIHNFVIRGRVAQEVLDMPTHELKGEDASGAQLGTRTAHWQGVGPVDTPVYRLENMDCGNVVEGPALIEAEDTTIVVEPDWRFTLDDRKTGVLDFTGSEALMATTLEPAIAVGD